ncbi:hypothetical protein KHP62_08925 [Rhodobacteraceae bacterium NNCM2]|nr:hypothetical protein [Coraliihabitans acroporae]
MADLDIPMFLTFTGGAFIAVWSGVVVSAFLPRRMAPAAGEGVVGAALIYGAAILVLAVVLALAMAAPLLPTAVVVIGAGLAILGAPFLAEPIPQKLRESRGALIAVLGLSAGALIALPSPV